jgi:hypothetical protein
MAVAFHGDNKVYTAARKEARHRFDLGRAYKSESEEAQQGVAEARNVGKFLRENLVQGIKDETKDSYRIISWNYVDLQDYGYTTRLNEETTTRSRIPLQCRCQNANYGGKRQIYHSAYLGGA